jgi:hypothetical protein
VAVFGNNHEHDYRSCVMDRGKRLSRGNVIGRQGELAFAQWALDHHLSANRVETDLGVDFFCQVMAPVADSDSIEGAGPSSELR